MAINLIPPQLKKEKVYRRTINIFFSFLAIVFIVFLILTATLKASDYYYEGDLARTKTQLEDQNQTLKKYSEIKNEVNLINKKLDEINSIEANRILWSNIVSEMARSTPVQVQLKTVTASADNKKINILGVAATRRDIAKFKEKLEDSKNFQNVVFTTSTLNEQNNNFNFNMNCELEESK